eukprot:CAMPEP_0194032400 /NCGR_PEP_ID=MMETSP0009_2-20130614/5352_1 /TAXON_ID=210454 /ORGANISM="Grammatophora oceanica, Strain CCMP 410" /LENGTH=33 /DNA_ID= /DNA_START= /DNA_END= /DNA_ORIENTATION=
MMKMKLLPLLLLSALFAASHAEHGTLRRSFTSE